MPDYATLSQGKMVADDQFEVRYQIAPEHEIGAFYFQFHRSFRVAVFLVPERNVAQLDCDDFGLLFKISEQCIEPVNAEFPPNVRLNRRPQEDAKK